MSAKYELPPEAWELIREVTALEQRARKAHEAFERDAEALRRAARKEKEELTGAARREDQALSRRHVELADIARQNDMALGRRQAEIEADRRALEALIENKVAGFAFIARAWGDYEEARAREEALALERKSHPALSAAVQVRAKGQELAEARRRAKLAEWIVALYEYHLPWITELRDEQEEESFVRTEEPEVEANGDQPPDPAQRWLPLEQYRALPPAERNQRALDHYLKSRKTRWQLGRDYERYIGYLREQDGCTVRYQGIFKGFEDLGRDVIAEKDGETEIVQCKRWAKRKTIHEKHVFQLYGTVVLARLEDPSSSVSGTFTTTAALSEKAKEVANFLGIRVEEGVPLRDYPRIKCNVNRVTGERIYHLPFDQRYDATVIEPRRGEFYASTVAEAEARGFRRAWRWRSSDAQAVGS